MALKSFKLKSLKMNLKLVQKCTAVAGLHIILSLPTVAPTPRVNWFCAINTSAFSFPSSFNSSYKDSDSKIGVILTALGKPPKWP